MYTFEIDVDGLWLYGIDNAAGPIDVTEFIKALEQARLSYNKTGVDQTGVLILAQEQGEQDDEDDPEPAPLAG